jgi:hypothetical protein
MEQMPVLEYQRRDTLSWGIIEQKPYTGVTEKVYWGIVEYKYPMLE